MTLDDIVRRFHRVATMRRRVFVPIRESAMVSSPVLVAGAFLVLAGCHPASPWFSSSTSRLDERIAAALKWLPEDTETVIVANGPFRVRDEGRQNAQSLNAFYEQDSVSFVDLIRESVFTLAVAFGDDTASPPSQKLFDITFEYALEGSRGFRAPRNLGLMLYEGALVAAVGESEQENLRAFVDAVAKVASRRDEISGTAVFVYDSAREFGIPTIYAASPNPGLLCVATDPAYLETVLQRMSRPGTRDALPNELPEWRQVDPTASVFAIRHFRHDAVPLDPTSPFRRKAAANTPDMKAIGIVFECREGQSQTAIARYLSDAPDPVAIARRGWIIEHERLDPRIELLRPGVVEISYLVVKPFPASRFFFVLTTYLGHGIYP